MAESKMTGVESRKQELILGLKSARGEILQMASQVSEESASEAFLGIWSLKDLLAHLEGWDHTNYEAVNEILAGIYPGFFKYYDLDWKSYNRELVEKYRKTTLLEQVIAARDSHDQLLRYLGSLSPVELMNGKTSRPGGRIITIRHLLTVEMRDELIHGEQINKHFGMHVQREQLD